MTRFLVLAAALVGLGFVPSNVSAADYWTSAAQREQIHQMYLTPAEHSALHQGLGNSYGSGYGNSYSNPYGNTYVNPYSSYGSGLNSYSLPSNSTYGWGSNYGTTPYRASYGPTTSYGALPYNQYQYNTPVRSQFGTSNSCQPFSNRPYGW